MFCGVIPVSPIAEFRACAPPLNVVGSKQCPVLCTISSSKCQSNGGKLGSRSCLALPLADDIQHAISVAKARIRKNNISMYRVRVVLDRQPCQRVGSFPTSRDYKVTHTAWVNVVQGTVSHGSISIPALGVGRIHGCQSRRIRQDPAAWLGLWRRAEKSYKLLTVS